MLPLLAAPDKSPRPPKRELLLEHVRSLSRAFAASLVDPAEKPGHLAQGLFFARLEKMIDPGEPGFVAQD